MKSKDLQKVVLSKYQNGDNPTKIYRDLNGGIGLRIKRCCQMIHQSGSIKLSSQAGARRFARTKGNMQKVEHRLRPKKRVSARKLSMDLQISERSVRRIMKKDLGLRPYTNHCFPMIKRPNGKNSQIGFEQIFEKRTL